MTSLGMEDLLADLAAEQAALDALVAGLPDPSWDIPTPAEPWTIRDQIGHLAFFDEQQTLALTDPDGFAAELGRRLTQGPQVLNDEHLRRGREMSPAELVGWWRQARGQEVAAFSGLDPDRRITWFGPPMRATTAVQARLMETWAHGQDIVDALTVTREPTARLFHVADLGVKTFAWSFRNRGLEEPPERVRVALRGPSGRTQVWNDAESDSVTGPLEEFCLVVVQRRHHLDTHLVIEGETARRWMEIAQAFAGPPGPGRAPASS